MNTPRTNRMLGFLALLILVLQVHCLLIPDDKEKGNLVANVRPTVRVTGGAMAPDSAGVDYKVQFQWSGSDDDGVVVLYQWAADDTVSEHAWRDTTGFSARFMFRAARGDSADRQRFTDWHTFYIRAIDNEFAVSRPDKRYFNARTIAPTSHITFPIMGAKTSLQKTIKVIWDGEDLDASKADHKPAYFEYKLVHIPYAGADTSVVVDSLTHADNLLDTLQVGTRSAWIRVPSTVTNRTLRDLPSSDVLHGLAYAFAVRAVDEAGAIEPTLELGNNVITFQVQETVSTPTVTISEESMGIRSFPGGGSNDEWAIEVPAGRALRFKWRGDASDYGSLPGNSNYALDVPDPDDLSNTRPDGVGGWIGWGAWTGNQPAFAFSPEQRNTVHFLYVYMRDISDAASTTRKCKIAMTVIDFTHDKFAARVNDFAPSAVYQHNIAITSGPHLAFCDSTLLKSLPDHGTVYDLNGLQGLKLSQVAAYQNLVWVHAPGGTVNGFARTEKTRLVLSAFLGAGGRLFIFGGRIAGVYNNYAYGTWHAPQSSDDAALSSFYFKFLCYRNSVVGFHNMGALCPSSNSLYIVRSMNPAYPDLHLDLHKADPYYIDRSYPDHTLWNYAGGVIYWEGSKRRAAEDQPYHIAGYDSLYAAETWTHAWAEHGPASCEGVVGAANGAICGTRLESTKADTIAGTQHGRIIAFDFEPFFFERDAVTDAGTAAINWMLRGQDQ